MKQRNKEKRLEQRIKQWENATKRRDPVDPSAHHKPGSEKK